MFEVTVPQRQDFEQWTPDGHVLKEITTPQTSMTSRVCVQEHVSLSHRNEQPSLLTPARILRLIGFSYRSKQM